MTDPLGDLIRDTLTEFSQEARAVNLTQPALRQAKRRRTVVMTLSVGAFVVLAATATPLAFAAVNQSDPATPGGTRITPTAPPPTRLVPPTAPPTRPGTLTPPPPTRQVTPTAPPTRQVTPPALPARP